MLELIRQWLEAGVMEKGKLREIVMGTPQGGVNRGCGMPKDIIVLRKGGETLMGDILQDRFTIVSDGLGPVTRRQKEIAWIIFELYGKGGDQMMLHNHTQFNGKMQDGSIEVKLDPSGEVHKIPTEKIRTLKFDFFEPWAKDS